MSIIFVNAQDKIPRRESLAANAFRERETLTVIQMELNLIRDIDVICHYPPPAFRRMNLFMALPVGLAAASNDPPAFLQ